MNVVDRPGEEMSTQSYQRLCPKVKHSLFGSRDEERVSRKAGTANELLVSLSLFCSFVLSLEA